jgi:hypothetical protein
MGEKEMKQMLSGMSPAAKKELLDGLVVHILNGLNEEVKKDLLRTVVTGQKENRQLASMVEY